jgi:hypothetical protein
MSELVVWVGALQKIESESDWRDGSGGQDGR